MFYLIYLLLYPAQHGFTMMEHGERTYMD